MSQKDDEKPDNEFELNGRQDSAPAFTGRSPELEAIIKERAEKTVEKLSTIRKVKEISGNSEWLVTQEIMQEIHAAHLIKDPDKKLPGVVKLIEELKAEIEERYSYDEELKILLLQSVPSEASVRQWFKKDGWEEAVWAKLRVNGLFNKENRSAMINALFRRGIEGSDTAAKIWLTLSGDYSDKMDVNTDKRIEAYREINEILHRKNKE